MNEEEKKTRRIHFEHDGLLTISTGSRRRTKVWKEKRVAWSALVKRLSETKRTSETQKEFARMDKASQDEVKDVGGFVGGELENGRRTAATCGKRQLVTLDADFAGADFWDSLEFLFGDYACCTYSTHKHTKEKPRLRLVIPLKRPVTPDEYQAVSRKIAEGIGIDLFDDTTYQPHRLMYWPSTSRDGEFFFEWQDGPWLDPDKVLAAYDDWEDQTEWPVSSRQGELVSRAMKKQEDPLEKHGLIGAFCRAYNIGEAIEKFLPEVYEPFEGHEDRYTYKPGSSAGGAIVYEDKWLFSHHATDPATMKLCNAFDLVRIHKFGDLDEGKTTQDISKLPSYQKMMELVTKDEHVKACMMKEKMEEVQAEFHDLGDEDDVEEQDFSWTGKLKVSEKTGKILSTRANIRVILQNDKRIAGTFGWDAFSQRIAIIKPPAWRTENEKDPYWNDGDDSELRYLLETYYGIDSRQKIEDETLNAANRRSFHRVREFLHGLKWDGVKRMDTLFVDYLGAEDTAYTRTVTRKMLIAAVGRVEKPGLKFDNMVVLEGRQGIGKSYILKLLGGKWFSDSLTTVQGKEAYEQLRGCWLIEMGELAALKKSDIEPIKQFISKQVDTYRVAYGKRLSEFPRQCVFIGTTNEATFLRDHTGNRRFWPVKCGLKKAKKSLWAEDVDEELHQVWAEAVDAWEKGEKVWIGEEMERQARQVQREHTEENPYVGMIEEFLERELPESWYKLDLDTRRDYLRGDGFEIEMGRSFKRSRICILEVWCEMLGGDVRRLNTYDRKEIRAALDQLEGWERHHTQRQELYFGKTYGRQSAWVKKEDEKSENAT